MRESLSSAHGLDANRENVLGVLSLITWALVLLVSIKYLGLVLRADNHGEGGVLALTTLVRSPGSGVPNRRVLILVGLFGAALLFGDGVLTPAISVLSAVEGLEVAAPHLEPFVVPLTVAILVGLFLLQRRGTAGVGLLFGPITLLWFATLALLGLRGILQTPEVLEALDPRHGALFLSQNGFAGFLVLGSVFLVVTGAEALYADMGHFGRSPIRFSWFTLVFPSLLANYYGQGALVLADPSTIRNPFYLLAPDWALVPVIVLATLATVIASQAVITGVFSLTQQAVQLGYWPRTEVRHTSPREIGQIYVPGANWVLMLLTILVVLAFRSSSGLAAAYGIAIALTMVITTMLLGVVARERWGWPPLVTFLAIGAILVVELGFLAANLFKLPAGGWVSLVLAGPVFALTLTWHYGRVLLARRINEELMPIEWLFERLENEPVTRVAGNAVYMTGNPGYTPTALLKNLDHQKTLHERVLIVTILTESVPHVDDADRVQAEDLGHGFGRVTARYGYMERPDILQVLKALRPRGLDLPIEDTTFFLGRERILTARRNPLARLRIQVFAFMARNSQRATAFFNIPPDRVVEVGSQVEV